MKPAVMLNTTFIKLDPAYAEQVRKALPDYDVLVSPDRSTLDERIGDVEIVFGWMADELLAAAKNLKWIQVEGAGVERIAKKLHGSPCVLTNGSGVHSIPITEHLLGMMLCFARDIHASIRQQASHVWPRQAEHRLFELHGRQVLLVGTGAIGAYFAEKASALGMTVVGVRRHPEKGGANMQRVVSPADLHGELPKADFVVVTVPATAATRHMIGEPELRLMRPDAYLLNIGRGSTVDEQALVVALKEGRIAGAGLDVFETEPLPSDSPLWDMPQVIITAHYSGATPRYGERLWSIFAENLDRYINGRSLINVVDTAEGY